MKKNWKLMVELILQPSDEKQEHVSFYWSDDLFDLVYSRLTSSGNSGRTTFCSAVLVV